MGILVNVCFYNSSQSDKVVAKVEYRSISKVFDLFMYGQLPYTCYALNYKNEPEYELTIKAVRTLQEKLKNIKRIRVCYKESNCEFIKGKFIGHIDISYANR